MSETPKQPGRVRQEHHDHILKIIIDNVAKRNAFSPEMMQELSEALTALDRDDDLRVGVICADGDHFTSGLEVLRSGGDGQADSGGKSRPIRATQTVSETDHHGRSGHCLHDRHRARSAGDIVIAADSARFCQMESKRGIAPLGAHFRYITRAGWGNAMYHLFLCDEFSATEAYRIGLVQEVVEAGHQIERAMELAEAIARNAPLGIQVTKEAAYKYIEPGEEAAIAVIPTIRERVMDSDDAREGIQSFIERREAQFTATKIAA